MRRPRHLLPLVPPLLWLLALAVLGGAGLRWSLPGALPPPPPPPPPGALASAGPAPRHVTRSLSELGLAGALGLSDYALLLCRAPKAGSELLALLLQRLQADNGFRLLPLPRAAAGRLSATEQEELVALVTESLRREALPVAFHGAARFTNFSAFDRQSPTFVGLLRDPVERAMAGLHHLANPNPPLPPSSGASLRRRRRTGAVASDHANGLRHDGDLVDALERCLSSSEASGPCAWAEPQSSFFCGHDPRCRADSDWALRRAMANIDQSFPVVGVLEDVNATLAVLEARLPLFFGGAQDVYRHQLHEPHVSWDRSKLSNVEPEAREKVRRRLGREYELYVWAKQRLMRQHSEKGPALAAPGQAGQDRLVLSVRERAGLASDEGAGSNSQSSEGHL